MPKRKSKPNLSVNVNVEKKTPPLSERLANRGTYLSQLSELGAPYYTHFDVDNEYANGADMDNDDYSWLENGYHNERGVYERGGLHMRIHKGHDELYADIHDEATKEYNEIYDRVLQQMTDEKVSLIRKILPNLPTELLSQIAKDTIPYSKIRTAIEEEYASIERRSQSDPEMHKYLHGILKNQNPPYMYLGDNED